MGPLSSAFSWEFVTTLNFEWEFIRGHRRYPWTIWVCGLFRGFVSAGLPLTIPAIDLHHCAPVHAFHRN